MIQLNNLREMRARLPESICASTEAVMREALGLSAAEDAGDIGLTEAFGSPMFLVETIDDLFAVRSFDEGPNGRLSLMEAASGWFDVARWEEGEALAVFATVENAGGGPQFFIPKSIAETAPNVRASVALVRERLAT